MSKDFLQNQGPAHVAIIVDGNGRWAELRKRSRLLGHYAGARRVREIVGSCPDVGYKYLTIFAFSTENWKRTQSEAQYLKKEMVRVRSIGDRRRLDNKLVDLIDELELLTSENDLVHLTIVLNCGGRDEVARATKRLAYDVKKGSLDPKAIDEKTLTKYLDTYVLPDPDLVISASGEARISNCLLWQSAYAEYKFIDTLWPDFNKETFKKTLDNYVGRSRRYGGVFT
jgi:undecaprenyl diphosphate synthase